MRLPRVLPFRGGAGGKLLRERYHLLPHRLLLPPRLRPGRRRRLLPARDGARRLRCVRRQRRRPGCLRLLLPRGSGRGGAVLRGGRRGRVRRLPRPGRNVQSPGRGDPGGRVAARAGAGRRGGAAARDVARLQPLRPRQGRSDGLRRAFRQPGGRRGGRHLPGQGRRARGAAGLPPAGARAEASFLPPKPSVPEHHQPLRPGEDRQLRQRHLRARGAAGKRRAGLRRLSPRLPHPRAPLPGRWRRRAPLQRSRLLHGYLWGV
mmetsp:Transcript_32276/g.91514  ORF Transcript_32276/g.91514 Transcript_32276/m.91514 type:complete len:262 (+) Transcript_32276:308-1093(+)